MNNHEGTTNDSTHVTRRPRRERPPIARIAAAIIAAAALALLAAACSGSPSSAAAGGSPNAGDSSSSPSAVSYSACMRSHDVPNYPDPSGGQLPKGDAQAFGVSSSVFSAAQSACQHLLPPAGSFEEQASQCMQVGDCPPAVVQQMMATDRKFAQCMRSHGVPNWPDPTIGPQGPTARRIRRRSLTRSPNASAWKAPRSRSGSRRGDAGRCRACAAGLPAAKETDNECGRNGDRW
jgi:hypothetical protein